MKILIYMIIKWEESENVPFRRSFRASLYGSGPHSVVMNREGTAHLSIEEGEGFQ